ncbi:NBS-LRR class resistance protein Fy8-Ry8 [Abeliophyllum distichum]|uniref:NBS-LRR class resistance protein Fy8-Ry8 n=1 Tax=Abeliophyllum distichum TaxID=126358 RepID=A0ABD1RVG4_9LAMI
MAYASLLSLNQTLDQILHPHDRTEQPHIIMRSLHEQVSFLLSFLDVSSPQNSDKLIGLEERIRDAAYEAEDIIESSMSNQIVSESGSHEYRTESHISNQIVLECDQKFERLQKIIQELNSISDEVAKDEGKERNTSSATKQLFACCCIKISVPLTRVLRWDLIAI